MLLHFGRDRTPGVSDCQKNPSLVRARTDVNPTAGLVVLAGILEQILQDERSVAFFAGNVERGRHLRLHFEIEGIRERIQVLQPFFDERAEIDWFDFDLEVPCVHSREKEKIVDHAGEPIGLVMERGKFVVNFRLEVFPAKKLLETGAQNRHRRF